MTQYSEYTRPTVTGSFCSYAQLGNYNNGMQGVRGMASLSAPGRYIVPSFSAPPGYNTVSRGTPSCSGYGNMMTAYGSNGSGCSSQYVSRLCQ